MCYADGGETAVLEAPDGGGEDLAYGPEALTKFKTEVDSLLDQLHLSDASPTTMGKERLARTGLGGNGFHEAEYLFAAYTQVHDQLENLSKTLGLQIESMSLAATASQQGYDRLDEDLRHRMRTLNTEIQAQYDPALDPYARQGKNGQKGGTDAGVHGFGFPTGGTDGTGGDTK